MEPWLFVMFRGFDMWASRNRSKGNVVDPFLILSWVDTGLSVLSHGLSLATQVLTLILPFI